MKKFIFWTVIFSFSFFIFDSHEAYADVATFFVDSAYDLGRNQSVMATLQHEGERAHFYVSDQYWSGLAAQDQVVLLANIRSLSLEFDSVIYPKLRDIFGSEHTPGVDGDPKITILLTRMPEDAGGYLREQDGFPREKIPLSNEREMIYLNVIHIGKTRAKSFLAHEFQHLITLNQKILQKSVQEEVWLNEMRSEIAPTLLGYDNPDVYTGSNLAARAAGFLKTPSDAILDWENESEDYASINLFGQYILDHYGRSVFAAMMQSGKTGIESINEALATFGFSENFSDVYTRWTIANLVNNCDLPPKDVYCYKNPSLRNMKIAFGSPDGAGKVLTSEESTKDWRAIWEKVETSLKPQKPADHILKLDFLAPKTSNFRVPYIVYDEGGIVRDIKEMSIDKGQGVFFVEDFGFRVPKVVFILANQSQVKGTQGNAPLVSFSFTASTATSTMASAAAPSLTTPAPAPAVSTPAALLPDGNLIRAEGDYKVYITKGGYKRWIQSAEIFNFYGHLGFAVVQVLQKEQVALYKDSWLVRADGDSKVYEVNGDGTRHWLDMIPEKFTATGRLWDMVYIINKSELLWYKEGPSVK